MLGSKVDVDHSRQRQIGEKRPQSEDRDWSCFKVGFRVLCVHTIIEQKLRCVATVQESTKLEAGHPPVLVLHCSRGVSLDRSFQYSKLNTAGGVYNNNYKPLTRFSYTCKK